jgi:hypothetical protein
MPSIHVQHPALSHRRKDAGNKAVKCLSRIERAAVAEAGEDVADYPCALRDLFDVSLGSHFLVCSLTLFQYAP